VIHLTELCGLLPAEDLSCTPILGSQSESWSFPELLLWDSGVKINSQNFREHYPIYNNIIFFWVIKCWCR
jgi:hypothetical protein